MNTIETNVNKCLRDFENPINNRSWGVFIVTISSLIILFVLSYWLGTYHLALAALCWIPIVIFFCRLFIIIHDCGHNALFSNKFYNEIVGRISSLFILMPFRMWRYIHNMHHGAASNLNKRDKNPDLWTMTSEEYMEASIMKRIFYRFLRSSVTRIFFTPLILFLLGRFPLPQLNAASNISIIISNIIYGILFYYVITNNLSVIVLVIYIIPLYIFLSFAGMVFYLQHQFEETNWYQGAEWSNFNAAIHGSSYIAFKPFMQWVTGNVGYHHVHHLHARIPFYNLPDAANQVSKYVEVKPISFSTIIPSLKCKVWDEKSQRLIPYKDIHKVNS